MFIHSNENQRTPKANFEIVKKVLCCKIIEFLLVTESFSSGFHHFCHLLRVCVNFAFNSFIFALKEKFQIKMKDPKSIQFY